MDQLMYMFFDQLSRAVGRKPGIQRRIGKLLNAVGSIVTTAKPMDPSMSTIVGSAMKLIGNAINKKKDLDTIRSKLDNSYINAVVV